MNNEKMNQIIDEAYENYLKNFVAPICPLNLDVQPDYYAPMTKHWFVECAKEPRLRGEEFSKKWGLKIEERELSLEERNKWSWDNWGVACEMESVLDDQEVPKRVITITYNNEKIEIYEN